MNVVNLVIAILVALGAAGVALMLSNSQTAELQKEVATLKTNLEQTRGLLENAQKKLNNADTTELRRDVDNLAGVWDRVDDLKKEDAKLKAEIDKLAEMQRAAAAAPVVAGSPAGEQGGSEELSEQDMDKMMRGLSQMGQRFGQRMLDRQMETFTKELNLNETQAADVKKLMSDTMTKGMEQMRKAFEGGEGERPDFQALRDQFEKEFNAELEKILTPEQMEKFQEVARNQMRGMGGMFGGPGRGARGGGGQGGPGAPGGNR
jgi:Spy/CpxP family protein refolding chaperone